MIVLDASALVDYLLDLPPFGGAISRRMQVAEGIAAPHLIDVEVGQVLRRFVLSGTLSRGRAKDALADLEQLGLTRYGHLPFLPRAFELLENVTFYDGIYLALAEALGAPLVTRDSALRGVPGYDGVVELFA